MISLAACRVVAALVTLACSGAVAAAVPGLQGLDSYIERTSEHWKGVGVAVAVVQGEQIIYARGFGVRELGDDAKVDADTLFQVGSTTKGFTTTALGMLVDEGKLAWDDAAIDHFPGFQLYDPWVTRHLTVRDMVSHRSGIAGVRYNLMAVMNEDQALAQLRFSEPVGAFRDSYHYSNLMFGSAGRIVQHVSGRSWHEFVKQRIFVPLGMNRSGTSPYDFWDARYVAPAFIGDAAAGKVSARDARDRNVAMPHIADRNGSVVTLPWRSYDNAAAAGSIVSSANDMAKWLMLHLSEGRVAGRQLLKQQTVDELHTVQNLHVRNDFPIPTQAALGWFRGEYRGTAYLQHGGGVIGFPAFVAMLPERRLGVVVLANVLYMKEQPSFAMHNAIALHVFDRLLGVTETDWNERLSKYVREVWRPRQAAQEIERPVPIVAPSLALEEYAGNYVDRQRPTGALRLDVANGQLRLSFNGEGAFVGYLEPWYQNVFRLRSRSGLGDWLDVSGNGFVTFTVDAAGKVISLTAMEGELQRVR